MVNSMCLGNYDPRAGGRDLGRAAPTSALIAPRPSEFLEQPGLLPEGSNATCFIVGSARAAAGGRLEFEGILGRHAIYAIGRQPLNEN